jgi:hypothetical protein
MRAWAQLPEWRTYLRDLPTRNAFAPRSQPQSLLRSVLRIRMTYFRSASVLSWAPGCCCCYLRIILSSIAKGRELCSDLPSACGSLPYRKLKQPLPVARAVSFLLSEPYDWHRDCSACSHRIGVTLLGLVMLVIPGPGWLVILLGLDVLSVGFAWARRLLRRLKKRTAELACSVFAARRIVDAQPSRARITCTEPILTAPSCGPKAPSTPSEA